MIGANSSSSLSTISAHLTRRAPPNTDSSSATGSLALLADSRRASAGGRAGPCAWTDASHRTLGAR
eukprot:10209825-Alexandrium_andersonii.AAC.1